MAGAVLGWLLPSSATGSQLKICVSESGDQAAITRVDGFLEKAFRQTLTLFHLLTKRCEFTQEPFILKLQLADKAVSLSKSVLGTTDLMTLRARHHHWCLVIFQAYEAKTCGNDKLGPGIPPIIDIITTMEELVALHQQHAGPTHIETLRCYHDLARAYRISGDFRKAQEGYEKTLRDMEEHLSEDSMLILRTTYNLLSLLFVLDKDQEALDLLSNNSSVRQVMTAGYDPSTQNPYLLSTLEFVGQIHMQLEKYEEANPFFVQFIQKWTIIHGPEHPRCLHALRQLAEQQLYARYLDEAEVSYRTLIAKIEKMATPDKALLRRCITELGEVLAEQDSSRITEKETLLIHYGLI
ncbi:hypothetical protein K440DRAFT_646758 [Wilcoxina mikolae CBS 423.85]|nr:hypothetical protein K440DRAFT_646758 [Wilcoxina mikolae CBS 423.85]